MSVFECLDVLYACVHVCVWVSVCPHARASVCVCMRQSVSLCVCTIQCFRIEVLWDSKVSEGITVPVCIAHFIIARYFSNR